MASLNNGVTMEPDRTSMKHNITKSRGQKVDIKLPDNYRDHLLSLHPKAILRKDPVIGRGFVSSGRIDAGEVILKEKPVGLCVNEAPVTGGFEMCWSCLKIFKLSESNEKGNGDFYYCSKRCKEHGIRAKHGWKRAELEAMGSSNLLLLANLLITRPKLKDLQSEVSMKQNKEFEDMIAKGLQRLLNILELENEPGILEIAKHYAGVVFVNSFGVRFNVINTDDFAMALYEKASFFNHSCSPNCYASWEGSTICIRTLKGISEGEALTIAFVTFVEMHKTSLRKKVLSSVFGFDCCCKKCQHPPKEEAKLLEEHPTISRIDRFASRNWANGDVNAAFKFYSKMLEDESLWLPKYSKSIESLNEIAERALNENDMAVIKVGREASRMGTRLCEQVVDMKLCNNLMIYHIRFLLYDMILCLVEINSGEAQETMMKNLEIICQLGERLRGLTSSMNLNLKTFCGKIPHSRLCSAIEFFEQSVE